jgi:transcriptional regulator with XRE-family HTH domain
MNSKKTSIHVQSANQLLVKAREEAGLTQKQVSESGIVSQSELSKIENGYREISFEIVINLAVLYEKDIKYFIPANQKK